MAAKPTLRLVRGAASGSGFAPVEDVEAMAREKLERSGLTIEDAQANRIEWLDADQTKQLCLSFHALPSLKIPYFTPHEGFAPLSHLPKWPPFYRVRHLREPDPKPKDFRKYEQPKDTGICAYFPRQRPWPKIFDDYSEAILIVEGELKALKGCVEGFNVIGLGGVDSFSASKRAGIDFLPELEAIPWARREVIIIFDSDLPEKPRVAAALNRLAHALQDRGAIARTVLLPPGPSGEKVGLDDFLVAHSREMLSLKIAQDAPFVNFTQVLWELWERYAFVRDTGEVIELGRTSTIKPGDFHYLETAKYMEYKLLATGDTSLVRVNAAKAYLEWALRREVQCLSYVPGDEPLSIVQTLDAKGAPITAYNLWTGWGAEPAPGDVSPFLELIDHLFTGAHSAHKAWFLSWCAYPVSHPGRKLATSVLIHGLEEGTGKTLIGETLIRLYGQNGTMIGPTEFHAPFNDWAVGRQLVVGDEVAGTDKKQDLDALKKMITQSEVRVNIKYQRGFAIPDCINYFWTSNHPDALYLTDQDRRFFVHEVRVKPLPQEFYNRYREWMRGPGPGALLAYFQTYDTGDFDPAARAPQTEAKQAMAASSRSDLANWIRDALTYPGEMLRIGQIPIEGDLVTTSQFVLAYQSYAGDVAREITAHRMGKELKKAGAVRVNDGIPISVPNRPLERYYAVRNVERWATASLDELRLKVMDPLWDAETIELEPLPPPTPPPVKRRKRRKKF